MLIDIRLERPGDIALIHEIEAAAFEGEAHADLVDQLRADDALILSHVAEVEGEILGHAAYSFVSVTDGALIRHFPALGPIAVSHRPGSARASARLWRAPDCGR